MFELLESRTFLSGNVDAYLSRGSLVLRGDGAGNEVTVTVGPPDGGGAGTVVVSGGGDTTVNGGAGAATLGPATRDVRVRLGGGDDRLTLAGLRVGRDLYVRGAAGSDAVTLDSVSVAGRASLSTGAGADTLTFGAAAFAGPALVRLGAGDDAATGAATFAAGRRIDEGPGADVITLDEDGGGGEGDGADVVTKSFDFRLGAQGWTAGFADYPVGITPDAGYELDSGIRPLPSELGDGGTGFLLSGHNRSDDLFMYLTRRLGPEDGVVPGQSYRVGFDLTFASDAPTGCVGIGGSPGESVYLKAGAAPVEPAAVARDDGGEGAEPYYRLNVDQGSQSQGGAAASGVGTIDNGLACEEVHADPPFVSLERAHEHDALVTADADGQLWLVVGTDSGVEGLTTLYYQNVTATLTPAE